MTKDERIKQLEEYLERYKSITDAMHYDFEGRLVLEEDDCTRLEILEQDIKKELGE